MQVEEERHLAELIRGQRWAALATLDEGFPLVSMVSYATEPDFGGFLFFLSGLARHTRALRADPRASLAISQPDTGVADPQTLARVTIKGLAEPLDRNSPAFDAARRLYLDRLPASEKLFALGDFVMFRLVPEGARYVGGFARAHNVGADHLRKLAEA